MPLNNTYDEELFVREQQAEENLARGISEMSRRLDENAIRVDTPAISTEKNRWSLMDMHLSYLLGRSCTIFFKDGGRIENITLKAFDEGYLLLYGYFNVGLSEPAYRELTIDKSTVKIVTQTIDQNAIYDRIRRIKEMNDPTA